MPHIVVIGAGVVGLTTAWELKRALPQSNITLAAHLLPGDIDLTYTSPFAGANWCSFAGADERIQDLDRVGYHRFRQLADDPQSGVWRVPNGDYYTEKAVAENGGTDFPKWFYGMANAKRAEKLPPGTLCGYVYEGVVVSVPVYLAYLVQQCLQVGIQLQRISPVEHIDKVRDMFPGAVVVNCTGLMATRIQGIDDPNRNYPVKGQVVLVRNNIEHAVSVSGFEWPNEMLYIFPRKEGGCIIGGSFFQDNWDGTEDRNLTRRILTRALQHAPQLVDPLFKNNPAFLDIVRTNVGLRPFRDGGVRIEVDPKRKWLIHNYGAGGGGYQGSFGFAAQVVDLVKGLASAKL